MRRFDGCIPIESARSACRNSKSALKKTSTMPIDIRIQIDLTARQKHVIRNAVVSGVVLASVGLGVVIAAPKHTFIAGTAISASKMNENFVDLDSRLTELDNSSIEGAVTGSPSRMIRARVSGAVVTLNDGSVTSSSVVTAGDIQVNIATGTFSAEPICTCSGFQDNRTTCSLNTTTSSAIRVYTNLSGALATMPFNLNLHWSKVKPRECVAKPRVTLAGSGQARELGGVRDRHNFHNFQIRSARTC